MGRARCRILASLPKLVRRPLYFELVCSTLYGVRYSFRLIFGTLTVSWCPALNPQVENHCRLDQRISLLDDLLPRSYAPVCSCPRRAGGLGNFGWLMSSTVPYRVGAERRSTILPALVWCPSSPSIARVDRQRHMHSLHCHSPVSMDIRRIDPSLALAFYLPDRQSFEDLIKRIRQVTKGVRELLSVCSEGHEALTSGTKGGFEFLWFDSP